jgi:peptidoglycan hydrolase-like protein with peptidoglycan-binding domain
VGASYTKATTEAVLRFQQEHDLPADGIPSKKTLMSIFEIHNAELSSD